jgi:hypothetical protein
MLHTKLINDLDEMRHLVFPPPYALLESIEDAEQRGEKWWVIMAYEGSAGHAQWVSGLRSSGEAQFFSEEGHLSGRWDWEHEIFIPEEGSPLDLRGRATSLASLIDQVEEETAEEEEKQWEQARKQAHERGSISWGRGDI